ncbi:MAG TPA: adenylate/guanylate cyclase domain-containing protein [Actinomycetota bacterium]|nr:adenylate/guanylate cyclase domain-containing protein [Actinomycetota bacterium]
MAVCPSCGGSTGEGARFCASCGTSLVPACPACGAESPEGARFCPSCGGPLLEPTPPPAGQERRLVTILFADVTGSTSLGERLDPERLQEVLGTYFRAMREEIEAEGGTVEKFIGDAVMAVFGVPIAHEDDPRRALRAALRMRDRLELVNAELRDRVGVTLRVRTGVNTGEVLAATNPRPGEPMVTGDAVNVAARLEQAAEPDQILVAERTARAARGFRYRELGQRALRGKDAPVAAVILLDEAPERADRGVPGVRAPMVGRDQELALLRTIYERTVAERRPNLVTIYGDPGVGKSRLTAEFVGWAEGRHPPPRVVRGRCLPYGDGITYWPLAEILKSLAGVLDTDTSEEVLGKIEVSCDTVLAADPSIDAARTCRAIAYTVGLEFPQAPLRDLEPRQVRAEMHLAWRSLFSALALAGPVVAVLEDIHWADPALLDLLEELAERVRGPVLFVCPARPALTDRRPGWGGGRRNHTAISLEPLSPEESHRLIAELLAVAELPARVRDRILERAEGNPFFLEEIVRHLIDRGQLVRVDGRWRAAQTIGEVEIPDTVQAVLAARIDLLEADEKRALQRAAVVGRVFWPGPVRRLLNGDGDRIRETLERLEARELVLSRLGSSVAGEPEFIFKHVLTRDVAYETLPRRERGPAHAAVARWIEETTGARSREFRELLAHHYLEAYGAAREADDPAAPDLRARAFATLMDVVREARRRFAVAKAISSAERALELADGPAERVQALEELGLTALNDYQRDRAWEAFREAVDLRLAHLSEDRLGIVAACARALESPLRWPGSMKRLPEPDVVRRYLQVGADHLDDEETEAGVRLLTARAFEPFGFAYTHEPTPEAIATASAEGERAAEIALRLGRADLASAALDGASSTLVSMGLYGPAQPIIERRLALADRIDDPWELGDIYAMASWGYCLLGRYAESERYGMRGAERAGDLAEGVRAHNLNWAAFGRFQKGDWDGVLELFDEVAGLLRERLDDPPYFMAGIVGAAAFVREAREEPDAGLERSLERIRVNVRPGVHGSVAASCWLAWLRARRGDLAGALDAIAETELVRYGIARPFREQVAAEILVLAERWDEVPAVLARARAYASEAGLLALPAHLDALEGRAALAAGDAVGAIAHLERAREGFARLPARWERARVELDLSRALLELGRVDEARADLEAAAPDLETAGARIELRRLRELRDRATAG